MAYGLVILWALAGILTKHLVTFGQAYRDVIWTVIAAIVLVGVFTLVALFRRLYKRGKPKLQTE